MRNGNKYTRGIAIRANLRSYPTYEEWKLCLSTLLAFIFFSSYPTYEEWKHVHQCNIFLLLLVCSYPTYEEWKLAHLKTCSFINLCSYPTYEEWKPKYSVNNRFPLKMFLSYL